MWYKKRKKEFVKLSLGYANAMPPHLPLAKEHTRARNKIKSKNEVSQAENSQANNDDENDYKDDNSSSLFFCFKEFVYVFLLFCSQFVLLPYCTFFLLYCKTQWKDRTIIYERMRLLETKELKLQKLLKNLYNTFGKVCLW